MDVALFDTRDEAEGFVGLLRDVDGVIARVRPEGPMFGVSVPDDQGFRASLIYRLYYIKGMALEDLSRRTRDERLAILAEQRAHAAARGTEFPRLGSSDLDWFKSRAKLSDADLSEALPKGRRRWSLFRRRRRGSQKA